MLMQTAISSAHTYTHVEDGFIKNEGVTSMGERGYKKKIMVETS